MLTCLFTPYAHEIITSKNRHSFLTRGSSAGVSMKASYSINLSLGAAREHPFQSPEIPPEIANLDTALIASPGEFPRENCDPR